MALSNTAKKKILKSNVQAMFPYLIEITDNSSDEVFRYANTDEDITFSGAVYNAYCFGVSPPEASENGIGDGKLTLSAVDGQWIARLRSTDKRFSLRFVAVMDYDESGNRYVEKIDDMRFTLTQAEWNDESVTWTMSFDENMDINFPPDKMTELICPGVV